MLPNSIVKSRETWRNIVATNMFSQNLVEKNGLFSKYLIFTFLDKKSKYYVKTAEFDYFKFVEIIVLFTVSLQKPEILVTYL